MPKSMYRKRRPFKRSVKKYRRYRRKTGVSKSLGFNPVIYQRNRLTQYTPLLSRDDGQDRTLNVSLAWQQPGAVVGQTAGFNQTPRWLQVKGDFEQYAVKGLKVEYIPTNCVGVSAGGVTSNIH